MSKRTHPLSPPQAESESLSTRRTALIHGAALVAGVGIAASTVVHPRIASAQVNPEIQPLNAMLSMEYLLIAAYSAGAGILTSPPSGDPLAAAAPIVLAVAVNFLSHHQAHAAALLAKITAAGGVPVSQSDIVFTAPQGFSASVLNVIKLAGNAEKIAAIEYAESIKAFSTDSLAQLSASIGGNESQHFILLSLLAQNIASATANTQPNASDVVPVAFVFGADPGMTGLETVPNFTYT